LACSGCLLIRLAGATVLVDTGADDALPDLLAEHDIRPNDVDTVVITHGHADHVGALLRNGAPAFPRARHLLAAAEQTFWTDPAIRSGVSAEAPGHNVAIDLLARALPVLHDAGLLHPLTDGEAISPGVSALAAPGHTPGHTVVAIESRGRRALHLGDVVSHRLHVEHPDWLPVWDLARIDQVTATKARLLAHAADSGALVTASHIPDPGHIVRVDGVLRWAVMSTEANS
jgi:glyoxylase-like metal-dependent hydrolase (beta-lactamase superfamily II)